ncbi:MAG: PP2C family protein-serine/threonine phosphatase [Planctomycetota bacterium]|jgi:sigma-B regulation protein RsbU (phosphoserine phosphatase)
MTVRRVKDSIARRASRAAFAAAAAVALYTAAGYGALIYAGLAPAPACVLAAAVGVVIAAIAGRVVLRGEELERRRAFAQARLESARARANAKEPAKFEVREVRESREIQTALLPREVPFLDGYHLEVDYQPCGTLSGDFYDFRGYDDGRLLLTLGDVSGKGPAGAIVMAMVQTLFRDHAEAAAGPADLLRRVNAGFSGALGKGVFVTALVGMLDPDRHRLTLGGAGHHPVLLLNPAERRTTQVGPRGLALGLVSGEAFTDSLMETSIDLAPGDSLLLYTDGATDCVEELSKGVGESRFLAAAAGAILHGPHGALKRLRDDLWAGSGRRDDTTLMLVSRVGGAAPHKMPSDRSARNLEV